MERLLAKLTRFMGKLGAAAQAAVHVCAVDAVWRVALYSPCVCDPQRATTGLLKCLNRRHHPHLHNPLELRQACHCTYSNGCKQQVTWCKWQRQSMVSLQRQNHKLAGGAYLARVPTLSPPFLLMKLGCRLSCTMQNQLDIICLSTATKSERCCVQERVNERCVCG